MRLRWCVWVLPTLCIACGGNSADSSSTVPTLQVPSEATFEPTGTQSSGSGTSQVGLTFENPLKHCGALESYTAVARYQCDDGSTPLGGDPQAGQMARRGSSRSHAPPSPTDIMNSHIVDMYEVPCQTGPVTLYVCLYHCPDGQNPY